METKLNEYFFKTNINSVYQAFWITYDIYKLCPNTVLNISNTEKSYSTLSIMDSSLSLSQIQIVFKENQIEYEEISHSIKKNEPKTSLLLANPNEYKAI